VSAIRYRIVIKGRLSERFVAGFEGLTLDADLHSHDTALVGAFSDKSQLYGVLERLRNLGIELVSVNAIE
jgi:hypothetical protein